MMGPKSLAENIAERRARRAAAKEEAVLSGEIDESETADLSDDVNLEVEVDESPQFTLDDLVLMVSNYHTSSETFDSLFASMSPLEAQKVLIMIHANLDRFSALGSEDTNLPNVVQELLRHDPRYTELVSRELTEEQNEHLETVSLPGAARSFVQTGLFESLSYSVESAVTANEEDIVIDIEPGSSEPNVNDGMPNAEALLDKQSELNASLTDGVMSAHGRLDDVEGVVAQLAAPVRIVTQEDIDAQSNADAGQPPVDLDGDPELNASAVVPPVLYDHADDPEFDSQIDDTTSGEVVPVEVDLDQISAGDIAKQLGISYPDVLSLANLDQGDSSTMVSRAEVVTALDALKRLVAVEPEVQAPIDVFVIEVVDGSDAPTSDDPEPSGSDEEVTASGAIDISEDFLGEFVASADACLEILKSI